MTSCSTNAKYTPAQCLATLYTHFVTKGGAPGINDDGQPVYPLSSGTKEVQSGCAVYQLALVSPSFTQALREIGTHAACSAKDLPKKGVPITDLLETHWMHDTAGDFLQALQTAHDKAALIFHVARTRKPKKGETPSSITEAALLSFRTDIARNLDHVRRSFSIKAADVGLALVPPPAAPVATPETPVEAAKPVKAPTKTKVKVKVKVKVKAEATPELSARQPVLVR